MVAPREPIPSGASFITSRFPKFNRVAESSEYRTGVLNILVSKIRLQCPRVVCRVGGRIAAGVPNTWGCTPKAIRRFEEKGQVVVFIIGRKRTVFERITWRTI
jgi:hypothetical protein